ncbi:hypothetical protein LINGRAHAP2_LOCUS9336 [Linum grandiflorum]
MKKHLKFKLALWAGLGFCMLHRTWEAVWLACGHAKCPSRRTL